MPLIYQLSTKPVSVDDWLCEYEVDCNSFEYVEEVEDVEERKNAIVSLCECCHLLTREDDNTLIYNGGVENVQKEWVENFLCMASSLTVNLIARELCRETMIDSIQNPLCTSALFCTAYNGFKIAQSASLIEYILKLKPGERLYVGAIFRFKY